MLRDIKVDPEIHSGKPCFSGTRVPLDILFDYLEGDSNISEFLRQYPTVEKQQVIGVLKDLGQMADDSLALQRS